MSSHWQCLGAQESIVQCQVQDNTVIILPRAELAAMFFLYEVLALQSSEKQIKQSSSLFVVVFIWILMFHLVTASFRRANFNS